VFLEGIKTRFFLFGILSKKTNLFNKHEPIACLLALEELLFIEGSLISETKRRNPCLHERKSILLFVDDKKHRALSSFL